MDMRIAGEQTDGSLAAIPPPVNRALSNRVMWWMTAVLLAGIITIVLPIQQIRTLGARLNGTIGSYSYTPPPAPTLIAVNPCSAYANVYYNQVSAATSYSLYRSDKTYNGKPYSIASGTGSSLTDNNATANSHYTYWVTTSGSGGESSASSSASATIAAPVPPSPAFGKLLVSGGSIKAYFSTVTGASSYNAYRDGWLMQKGVTSPYTDGGVPAGTSHWYTFGAVNSNGQGSMGPYYLSAMGGATPPVTTNLAAVAGSNTVQLTWNGVSMPNGNSVIFNLYRSTSAGGEGDIPVASWIGSNNANAPVSYTDTSLSAGTTYYYKVAAVSNMGGGEGTLSNEASATPATQLLPAPQLSAAAGDSSASLSWTAVAGATSYNVYRSCYNDPVGKGSVPLVEVGGSGTTYTDSGLTNGSSGYYTWYYYTVYAVSKDGQGTGSQSVSVDPGSPAPTLKSHVLWTSDYTVTPNVQTGSDSGMVAGDKSVHLSVLVPPNITSAVANSVTIHEDAGDTQDVVATNVSLTVANPGSNTGGWSSVCGDPNPLDANAPTMAYCDVPWSDAGTHDGNYTITVNCQATVGGSATPVALTATKHVDNEDVLIKSTDPAHPVPVIWNPPPPDPTNPNPAPYTVPVKVTLSAADKRNRRVRLSILSSQTQDPAQMLLRTMIVEGALGGKGDEQKTFTWDGKKDDGSILPAGLYFFKFDVFALDQAGNPLAASETEQSNSLTVSVDPKTQQLLSVDAQYVRFTIDYTLADASVAAGADTAKSIQMDLYGPDWKTRTMSAPTNLTLKASGQTTTISVDRTQFDKKGTYTFVLSASDVHANQDIGHRNRWALSSAFTVLLNKSVLLTDPVDTPTLMLFHGKSEAHPSVGQPLAPCPVVIRGKGPAGAMVLLTYEKQRKQQLADGTPAVAADGTQQWSTVQSEQSIPGLPGPGVLTDQTGFFSATWNQQLDRTQSGIAPIDPLTGQPIADQSLTGQEAWLVRAYTFINPVPVSPKDAERRFRVFTMAHPVAGSIVENGDFVEVGSNRSGTIWVYALDPAGHRFFLPFTSSLGNHLALDFGANAKDTINAAEAGTVTDSDTGFKPAPFGVSIDPAFVPQLEEYVNGVLKAYSQPLAFQNNLDADKIGYPWGYFDVTFQSTGADNSNRWGPNIQVSHSSGGKINMGLVNGVFDQVTVATVYCHMQAPVANNTTVDISTRVASVGDFPMIGDISQIENIFTQKFYSGQNLLNFGYFTLQRVTLTITPHTDALGSLARNGGSMIPPASAPFQAAIGNLSLPSVSGPHLHFEVRITERKNIPVGHDQGEQNPHNWLYLPFGATSGP